MKILFVDDSATVRAIYENALTLNGYDVISASSKDEALNAANEHKPDLAIVDFYMPKGNGDELTRELLCNPQTSQVLVVMHSNRADVITQALNSGAIDLMFKEDPIEIFLMRVSSIAKHLRASKSLADQQELARIAAEEASHAKTAFLATMSHELRTPLNSIIGFSEMLSAEPYGPNSDKRYTEFANNIYNSGKHLLSLIGDILDISKIEAGGLVLEKLNYDVDQMLDDINKSAQAKAQTKGLIFTHRSSSKVPKWIKGDPTRMLQVISNLVDNAIKFTLRGSVKLVLEVIDAGILKVSVIDTGIGVPDHHQKSLFEPFMQADSTITRKHGGTGLGLSICKQIVVLMNGEIGIESELNQKEGTTFWFTLPLVRGSPESSPTLESIKTPTKSFKILVVEDVDMNAFLIKVMLERIGHTITRVVNGKEALETASQYDFDLILMDLRMPVMDGIEATLNIRMLENKHRAETPIIGLSADVLKEQQTQMLDAGMNDCLSKPFGIEEIQIAISNAVENKVNSFN